MTRMIGNNDNIDVVDVDFEDKTSLENDNERELNDILNEFNKSDGDVEYKVKVYGPPLKQGGPTPHLFDCGIEDFPINDRLRNEYGTGEYKARLYKNSKLFKHMIFAVRAPIKPTVDSTVAQMQPIAAAMDKQSEMMSKMLQQMTENQRPELPASSPMEMMTTMVGMMVQMKEFLSPPQNNGLDAKDVISLLSQGIDMGKDMGGDSDSNMMDVAKAALEALPAIAQQAAPAQAPVMQNPRPLPQRPVQGMQPHPQPHSRPQVQPQAQEQPAHQEHPQSDVPVGPEALAGYLTQLVDKARKGSDPLLYADVILDNVDTEVIKPYIQNDMLLDQLCMMSKEIEENKDWFRELILGIKEGIEQIENNDVSSIDVPQQTENAPPATSDTVREGRDQSDVENDVEINEGGEEEYSDTGTGVIIDADVETERLDGGD